MVPAAHDTLFQGRSRCAGTLLAAQIARSNLYVVSYYSLDARVGRLSILANRCVAESQPSPYRGTSLMMAPRTPVIAKMKKTMPSKKTAVSAWLYGNCKATAQGAQLRCQLKHREVLKSNHLINTSVSARSCGICQAKALSAVSFELGHMVGHHGSNGRTAGQVQCALYRQTLFSRLFDRHHVLQVTAWTQQPGLAPSRHAVEIATRSQNSHQ